jgi:O-6-methylguanine DNA methyltransferase
MENTGNFKEKVYKVVGETKKGEVMTYKEVAKAAGPKKAWRAVGNILNKNKNPKIPCHRVIKSDGKIRGYNKGVENKKRLLEKEGFGTKGGKH